VNIDMQIDMKIHKSCEKGFTLIEVMVAMLILVVGILGMAKVGIGAMKSDSVAGSRTVAINVAQQVMEVWNATGSLDGQYGFTSTPTANVAMATSNDLAVTGSPTTFNVQAVASSMTAPRPDWDGVASIASNDMNLFANAPAENPLFKEVKVSWTQKNITRSVTLTHATTAY